MRSVVQRVGAASVTVGGVAVSRIDRGLLVLAGMARNDIDADLQWMSRKLPRLRIFEDGEGMMNLSVEEIGGSLLVISQFTLFGDASRGNRPGFSGAAPFDLGRSLFDRFVEMLRSESSCPVLTGSFGADMQVSLLNDGPVTIMLESPRRS